MNDKHKAISRLLDKGLTVSQVRKTLGCGQHIVLKVKALKRGNHYCTGNPYDLAESIESEHGRKVLAKFNEMRRA